MVVWVINVSDRLNYLNTWSPVGDAVWLQPCWRKYITGVRLHFLFSILPSFSYFCCPAMAYPPWWALALWNCQPKWTLSSLICLGHGIYHSNKATNTLPDSITYQPAILVYIFCFVLWLCFFWMGNILRHYIVFPFLSSSPCPFALSHAPVLWNGTHSVSFFSSPKLIFERSLCKHVTRLHTIY